MPNWCENHFSISGPKDKIEALFNASVEKGGLLEAMVPIGEWDYSTASETWGTKWDVQPDAEYSESQDGSEASITGSFDSAWAPPIAAFEAYSKENTDVVAELSYFEPGMCFTGRWSLPHGDESYIIEPTDLTQIPEDLVEEFSIDEYYEDEENEDE